MSGIDDPGTSQHCPLCEGYAKRLEKAKELQAGFFDEMVKRGDRIDELEMKLEEAMRLLRNIIDNETCLCVDEYGRGGDNCEIAKAEAFLQTSAGEKP